MAKGKSIPKKKISETEQAKAGHQITWYHNLKYYGTPEKIEDLPKKHIQLREFFKEHLDNWESDFIKKAGLTTNFEEFTDRNLSVCGINIKDGRHIGYGCDGLGISAYHIRGYNSAIDGNNPYMDEIEVPGMGSPIEMISQNLYDFMEGYLWSVKDSYALNFKLEGKEQNKKQTAHPSKEIFISDAAYIECMGALKNVNPPVISSDNRYKLGPRQKGAFAAWYELLKFREKLKTGITPKTVTEFLNKEIKGLELNESTLYRTHTTKYLHYKVPLSKLIE